jgi:methionine-rich copper-binding protein CopC
MNRFKTLRRGPRLRALAPALLAVLALAIPATALAHVEIVATSPSGTAKTTIKRVTVTFSGPILGGSLKVFGPDGSKASRGKGGRDPHNVQRLRTSLRANLPPGRYTAEARWTAADGHREAASFHFRLKR